MSQNKAHKNNVFDKTDKSEKTEVVGQSGAPGRVGRGKVSSQATQAPPQSRACTQASLNILLG